MQDFLWTVVGAGPAGIAAVGKLLDYGVDQGSILWIDPEFRVGDFGALWRNVPSNTKVDLFLKFLHACESFSCRSHSFELNDLPRDKTCYLSFMADALQWISDHLKKSVQIKKDQVIHVMRDFHGWQLAFSSGKVSSKNVILAIGSEPKKLDYPVPNIIALQDAMDAKKLNEHVTAEDVVAVFGSSHSAILVLKNLVEQCHVKKIINFYRSPLLYAVYTPTEILYDDTGLKGTVAEWAKQHLHDDSLRHLYRYDANDKAIQEYLLQCTKVIYAVGFQRRNIVVEDVNLQDYNDKTGVIAPGLYGFGIAFPEAKVNALGFTEYRVGLWKFMDYLERVLPVWLSRDSADKGVSLSASARVFSEPGA